MKLLIECEDLVYGTFDTVEEAVDFAKLRLQGREWMLRYMHVVPSSKETTT